MSRPLAPAELKRLAPQELPRFRAEGIAFLALTFAVGIAAMNTGNNLLYLVLAMMLAFFIVSGILALHTLRGVHGSRRVPPRVHEGSPALGELVLRNEKRWGGSYALECQDRMPGGSAAMMRFVPRVPAGGELRLVAEYRFDRRGVHKLPGLRIATRFPFGFIERARRMRAPDEALVYPALLAIDVTSLERALGEGGEPTHRRGSGEELHTIRPFATGDSPRHIAWKQSARADELLVRDFEAPVFRRATVRLTLPAPARDAPPGFDEEIENAIRRAAGTAAALIERGWAIRFVTHGLVLAHASGSDQLERILAALARLDPYGPPLPQVATPDLLPGEPPALEIQAARRLREAA